MNGLAALLPFVAPIAALLLDETVSDILVNADGSVHCERAGVLAPCGIRFPDLGPAVRRIARGMGRDVNEAHPLFDGRLGDGSRVSIVVPPCSVGGATLAIRKFVFRPMGLDSLVESGTIDRRRADVLAGAIEARETVLICGSTGAGKTTLLNALTSCIAPTDRIICIEEVNELRLARENVVYFESRSAAADLPEVTISELVREALRMRPDRIIVGEVRGLEAFDLLQALHTGHQGSLATIHANDCRSALTRLRLCVAMSGIDLAPATFAEMISSLIDLIVYVERGHGVRRVASMVAVEGYDSGADRYRLEEVV